MRVTVRHAAGCGRQAGPLPAGIDRVRVVLISRFCPMVPPLSVRSPVPAAARFIMLLKTADVAPVTEAVTENGPPSVLFAVTVAEARPDPSVTADVAVMPGPFNGPVNVTVTPATGLLNLSTTLATSGAAKLVPIVAVWPLPLNAETAAGGAAPFVNEKLAGRFTPTTVAATLYEPTAAFAVNAGEVATPEALVVAVAVVPPPANVPLAPLLGAVKVTETPPTRLPPASLTVADKGKPKVVPICALWPLPPVAVTDAAAPAVFVIE